MHRAFSIALLSGLALLTALSLYAPGSLSLTLHEADLLERASQPLVLQSSSIYSPF